MDHFTTIEQQVLHIIQTAFPLTTRPYETIGASIGLTEQEVIQLLHSLKERQIIRQISAIFHADRLDFSSALVSVHAPEYRLDVVAAVINAHPGVSHNYQRAHHWNLWFTLAVPNTFDILRHVQKLAELASCPDYLYLPSLSMFKRRVQFDLDPQRKPSDTPTPSSEALPKMSRKNTIPLETQRGIMAELQQDLPLMPTPFKELAARFQIEEETLFEFIGDLKTSRIMSRFAGILKHRQLGFTANAMVVWQIPADILQSFADHASALTAISHCYERITYPEWPYNVYTMIHGATRAQCQQIIADLTAQFQVRAYETLYSVKEFKKQRVNYFDNSIAAWHQQWIEQAL